MSTYTPIASFTVNSAVSQVWFSNIPQIYTDLILVSSPVSTTGSNTFLTLSYNNDISNSYSGTIMRANGSTTGTVHLNAGPALYITYSQEVPTVAGRTTVITTIPNYTNSTQFKQTFTRNNDAVQIVEQIVGVYQNTAPITTMTIDMDAAGSVINTGSTFNLYGISAGGGYALGGDIVTTDGTYWYHTFLSSGAFIPTKNLTADYLVVAGGGGGMSVGGGGAGGGGGGAGGYRTSIGGSALSLTSNLIYNVIVGAGGAATTSPGTKGSNSSFSGSDITTITSSGGGASVYGTTALSGGSGGGGTDGGAGGAGNAGGYTPVEGYAGGSGSGSGNSYGGGGGGGASAVGANGQSVAGGNGGAGTANSISGSSVTYAGGGGGATSYSAGTTGAGGAGGGGAGGNLGAGTAGTANTGGGGGGASGQPASSGGQGGSGIVIVRYAV